MQWISRQAATVLETWYQLGGGDTASLPNIVLVAFITVTALLTWWTLAIMGIVWLFTGR